MAGFDNECIKHIESLKGEYFCPVCRHLVFPDLALQTRCGHLFCKPCLSYVVQTTQACPYDGLLVSQIDSKPLVESDRALSDTIWEIPVRCLYDKSGCMWEGSLVGSVFHALRCVFGNVLVTCNKCAMRLPHRDIPQHRLTCTVIEPQQYQPQLHRPHTQHTIIHPQLQTNPLGGFRPQVPIQMLPPTQPIKPNLPVFRPQVPVQMSPSPAQPVKPNPPSFTPQVPVQILPPRSVSSNSLSPCGPFPRPLLPLQPPQRLSVPPSNPLMEDIIPLGRFPIQPPPWWKDGSTSQGTLFVQLPCFPNELPLSERLKTVPWPLLPLEPPQRLYQKSTPPIDNIASIKEQNLKKRKLSSHHSSFEKGQGSRDSDANGHDDNGFAN